VPGGTRISVTILDPERETETHVREPGVAPPVEGLNEVRAQLARLSPADWVVMAGSLPPGMGVETYRNLIQICTQAGAKTCLDANGAPLLSGVAGPPTVLKVNLFELCQVDGQQVEGLVERACELSLSELVAVARHVQSRGVEMVVVTLDERGAIGVGPSGRVWHAQTQLERPVVDAVGSGDAFSAGLVVALERGRTLDQALRLGVACGAANTLVAGAGRCDMDDIERLSARALVDEIL
jgi:fructose-1-phosphate kinase PfkB-like protein